MGVDDEDPWLAGQTPFLEGGRDHALGKVVPHLMGIVEDLHVDEVGLFCVALLQLLDHVQLRAAGGGGAEGGSGKSNDEGLAGLQSLGNCH